MGLGPEFTSVKLSGLHGYCRALKNDLSFDTRGSESHQQFSSVHTTLPGLQIKSNSFIFIFSYGSMEAFDGFFGGCSNFPPGLIKSAS